MLKNVDPVTAKQLQDSAINVANKSKKYAIFKMFSTKLKCVLCRHRQYIYNVSFYL